jgi:hypothetical protein
MSKTRAKATVKAPMFSSRLIGAGDCWCEATSLVARRRRCVRIGANHLIAKRFDGRIVRETVTANLSAAAAIDRAQ